MKQCLEKSRRMGGGADILSIRRLKNGRFFFFKQEKWKEMDFKITQSV